MPLASRIERSLCGSRQRGHHGFTLIEMLVVVAVIAILAALLLPALSKAKERGRMTTCISNIRQISIAMTMFTGDHDDRLPHLGILSEQDGRWMYHLLPYLDGTKVFTDPKVPNTAYDGTLWDDHTSYGLAEHLWAGSDYGKPTVKGVALSEVKNPADTIALGDTGIDNIAGWAMYRRDTSDPMYTWDIRPGYYSQFRHDTRKTRPMHDDQFNVDRMIPSEGRCVYGFLDGHSAALTPAAAFVVRTNESGVALSGGDALLLWNVY